MTNTLNTPIEALEIAYPLRIMKYSFRDNSGGIGEKKGGDGIVRIIKCLLDSSVSLQTERRKLPPYGLNGGEPGLKGVNKKITIDRKTIILPGRSITNFLANETLILETPGGGGFGKRI